MRSPEPLIFLHLPKTAGMTLRTVLAARYPAHATFVIGNDINADIDRFVHMEAAERARIRLLIGHMSFGLHQYLPAGARYLTMLRHPVDRVLSEYRFLRTNTRHPFHARVAAMSLEEYLESGFTGQAGDGQTRLLSGSHLPGRPGVAGREPLDESDLQRALENIDRHFVFAGIQERFEESLLLMARSLGWRRWPLFVARNVTSGGSADADVGGREAVAAFNRLDLALYRAVSERVDAAVVAGGEPLRRAVSRFSRMNRLYQRYESRRIQYQRRVRRLADGILGRE